MQLWCKRPQPLLTTTPSATVASQIENGSDNLDYNLYLTWRGFLDREPPRRPDPDRPGAPPAFRSEDWKYAFVGSRDRSSGAIHLPPMRVSMDGGAVDDMERARMADVPATIATFTVDYLAFSLITTDRRSCNRLRRRRKIPGRNDRRGPR